MSKTQPIECDFCGNEAKGTYPHGMHQQQRKMCSSCIQEASAPCYVCQKPRPGFGVVCPCIVKIDAERSTREALMFHPHNGREGFSHAVQSVAKISYMVQPTTKIMDAVQERWNELLSTSHSSQQAETMLQEETAIDLITLRELLESKKAFIK